MVNLKNSHHHLDLTLSHLTHGRWDSTTCIFLLLSFTSRHLHPYTFLTHLLSYTILPSFPRFDSRLISHPIVYKRIFVLKVSYYVYRKVRIQEPTFEMRWACPEDFMELQVMPRMLLDHLPENVHHTLETVLQERHTYRSTQVV